MVQDICREIDRAREDRGLTFAALGRGVGLSGQHVGRLCRGEAIDVSLMHLAELASVVGLELSARAFPGGSPVRDGAHGALLERLRSRLSPSLRWRLEVPVVGIAGAGDQRAWDATIGGSDWVAGVEAETHVVDVQALERRIALKQRDGGVGLVVLLLSDTTHHQHVLAAAPKLIGFETPARSALRALRRGCRPPGNAVLSL